MPEIIDGNAIDLIEAEKHFAQDVKFCTSRKTFQAAFLHAKTLQMGKHFG